MSIDALYLLHRSGRTGIRARDPPQRGRLPAHVRGRRPWDDHQTSQCAEIMRRFRERPKRNLGLILIDHFGLEHACDVVVLMHRGEKKLHGRVVRTSDFDFISAKNRQGEEATRTLRFEGQFAHIFQKEHETTALIEPQEV